MKIPIPFALVASLVLTAVLGVLIFKLDAAVTTSISPRPVASPAIVNGPQITAETWTRLGSADLPGLLQHLRAAGFPPEILRAILEAQIHAAMAERRRALDPKIDPKAFWKNQPGNPAVENARRELAREETKTLRDLLGSDAEEEDPNARVLRNQLAHFLSPEKVVDVSALTREFEQRRSEMAAKSPVGTPNGEALSVLETERRARLAQLLTPAELMEYNLRTDNIAQALRSQLATFEPSEAEFRAIYATQAAFDEHYGEGNPARSMLKPSEVQAAEEMMTQQIKTALGPERAAEYERATDYDYRRTNQVVARLELPPQTANDLWMIQKEFEPKRSAAQAAPLEERPQKLAALQQEALARLTPLLGDARGVEAYRLYAGRWLRTLEPQPSPASAPKN